MEFAEVVRSRRMVRSYDPTRAVSADQLDAIMSAALRAPSAGNTQAVSLLVLERRPDIDNYWRLTKDPGPEDSWLQGMRTAPVLILVWTSREAYLDRYAQPDKGWSDRDPARWSAPYWFVDAGMAALAALLAAVDSQLAACFFGIPAAKVAAVRTAFSVPSDELPVGAISLGYPSPQPGPRRRRPRRSSMKRVHRGSWAN
jgi:nitroreductase